MGSLALIGGILILGFSAGADDKKTSKPAPKPAAKTPAAAKGTTSSGAAKGPTTSGVSKGPTTSSTSKGPTTSGASKGPTTTTAGHGPTTAGAGSTTTGPAAGHNTALSTSGPAHNLTAGAGTRTPMVQAKGPIAHPEPRGSKTISTPGGNAVRMRANGSRSDVHVEARGNARAMDIHHGLGGGRHVEVERKDGSCVVVERGGHGYVQRPYRYGDREYAHRTYYRNGRVYDRYYAHYYYRGGYVAVYSPVAYYPPAYYGWAYNPWVAPVPYAWGWGGNPWYGYYGAYFTPYPVYPSASVWLTDYLISQTLMAAYQERAAAAAAAQAAAADAAPLTPEVKGLIAAEVQRQIALENAEARSAQVDPASSGINRMLTDNVTHVFVAGKDLDVTDAGGAECALSQGDAIQLTAPPPADATAATLIVLSSKGGQECRKGALISVAVADLQEMQNHMREMIDQGMGDLQSKQGHGGLPALPPSAQGEPVKTAFAANAPPPEPDVATQLKEQAQEADKAENDVAAEAAKSGGAPAQGAAQTQAAAPAQISMGQTIAEVTAILGNPKNIVDLGAKKIYVYNDMKITFKAGKVADVE